jgi:hypothetical protein
MKKLTCLLILVLLLTGCNKDVPIGKDECKVSTLALSFKSTGGSDTVTAAGYIISLKFDDNRELFLPYAQTEKDTIVYNRDSLFYVEYSNIGTPDYTMKIKSDWFEVKPETGENNSLIVVLDIKPNLSGNSRQFEIGVVSAACSGTWIKVTQSAE